MPGNHRRPGPPADIFDDPDEFHQRPQSGPVLSGRGHERQRQRVETVDLRVPVEVVLGVEDDGDADARDEQAEQQRQPIEREGQVEVQLWHPLDRPESRS